MGRRQVVRHRILIPTFGGSNPSAPVNISNYRFTFIKAGLANLRVQTFGCKPSAACSPRPFGPTELRSAVGATELRSAKRSCAPEGLHASKTGPNKSFAFVRLNKSYAFVKPLQTAAELRSVDPEGLICKARSCKPSAAN